MIEQSMIELTMTTYNEVDFTPVAKSSLTISGRLCSWQLVHDSPVIDSTFLALELRYRDHTSGMPLARAILCPTLVPRMLSKMLSPYSIKSSSCKTQVCSPRMISNKGSAGRV